jgi:hypothetical protein
MNNRGERLTILEQLIEDLVLIKVVVNHSKILIFGIHHPQFLSMGRHLLIREYRKMFLKASRIMEEENLEIKKE